MITKDQLEELKKPVHKNAELHYTIGGPIEAAVHSNVQSERYAKYHRGCRTMHKAVEDFRQNMAFKSREGLARSQFQQAAQQPQKQPEPPPTTEADTSIGVGQDRDKANQSAEYATRASIIRDETVQNFRRAMNDNTRTIERGER